MHKDNSMYTDDEEEEDTQEQEKPQIFPAAYGLTGYDILCGRSKLAFNHAGNRRFRVTISIHLPAYMENTGRTARSLLIDDIVKLIRSCGGHFLKEHGTGWIDIGNKEARSKVGHALRDAAATSIRMADGPKQKDKSTTTTKALVAEPPKKATIKTPLLPQRASISAVPAALAASVVETITNDNNNDNNNINNICPIQFSQYPVSLTNVTNNPMQYHTNETFRRYSHPGNHPPGTGIAVSHTPIIPLPLDDDTKKRALGSAERPLSPYALSPLNNNEAGSTDCSPVGGGEDDNSILPGPVTDVFDEGHDGSPPPLGAFHPTNCTNLQDVHDNDNLDIDDDSINPSSYFNI